MTATEHPPLDHWHHYRRVPFVGIDRGWRSWLLDQGSLTQRLINISNGNLRVHKLRQSWQRPNRSEANRLKLRPRELALIREVQLVCNGEPWVYARSVFPQASLTGRLRWLRNLDDRPLGAMLFRDPSMRRTLFELSAQRLSDLPIADNSHSRDAIVWGRRSLFFIDGKPLLVAEIFLPPAEKHARRQI